MQGEAHGLRYGAARHGEANSQACMQDGGGRGACDLNDGGACMHGDRRPVRGLNSAMHGCGEPPSCMGE